VQRSRGFDRLEPANVTLPLPNERAGSAFGGQGANPPNALKST
jgi:hypothetical protein